MRDFRMYTLRNSKNCIYKYNIPGFTYLTVTLIIIYESYFEAYYSMSMFWCSCVCK